MCQFVILEMFGILAKVIFVFFCILLPCGSQGLSANRVSQWQVLSADAALSGDMMFILGGFGEECMVPVGASFPNRGMRNDCHDAVSAQLMIPIGRHRPGGARPAASGASQPAVAAASAEQALEPEQPAGADRPAAGETPQLAAPAAAADNLPEPEQRAAAARPAAGGAPQPAVAATAASQPAVAAASAQQALAPAHAADAGRPAAGEAMLSKQMESPWQFFKRIENLLIAPGHFGPRGGWKRILFEKSLPKRGS